MKCASLLAGFLTGAAIGAAIGILFAPEKGEDTRSKINEVLRENGIKLSREDMEKYAVHPVHLPVKEYVLSVCEKSISCDYETEE